MQMTNGASEFVDLSVRGVTKLRLVTDSNGANSNDHTDWADAKLLGAARDITKAGTRLYHDGGQQQPGPAARDGLPRCM